jgi:hypothetical protein
MKSQLGIPYIATSTQASGYKTFFLNAVDRKHASGHWGIERGAKGNGHSWAWVLLGVMRMF